MRQTSALVTRFSLRRGARTPYAAARLTLALAAAVILGACASPPPTSSGAGASTDTAPTASGASPTAATVDPNGPVLVAVLAPTSASSKGARRAGQDLVAAAQLGRAERGPANMTMKIYDTRGTGEGAAEAAAHAIRDGAALILGPMLGASARAAGPVAAEAGVNVLAFSNDRTAAGGNVWVLGQTPADEMRRLFAYAGARGVGSVAVAYPTNRYGEIVAADAGGAGRDAGVGVGPFVGYERSFQGIERASKAGAGAIRGSDGVLIADNGDALRSMAAFLSYYDVSPRSTRYMGLSRWADRKNTTESGLIGGWFVAADPQKRAVFNQKFQSKLGRRPSAVAGVGYDAAIIAAALLRAGGGSPFSTAALTSRGFDGATGSIRLTRDGANRRGLAVMEVGHDDLTVIDPAPDAAPSS